MSTQSPDTKTERMTAQVAGEHLREQIKIINDIHRPPRSQPIARAVGDNALQEELGEW